jgi:hypothetical protein
MMGALKSVPMTLAARTQFLIGASAEGQCVRQTTIAGKMERPKAVRLRHVAIPTTIAAAKELPTTQTARTDAFASATLGGQERTVQLLAHPTIPQH